MEIKVFKEKVTQEDLAYLAKLSYGDMVKGVVDLSKGLLALGGELHADAEELLLSQGSLQEDLWGFNLYLMKVKDQRIEYTSFINIRPKQGNHQIEIKDENLRRRIKAIIDQMVE